MVWKFMGWVTGALAVSLGVWTVGSLFIVSGVEEARYVVTGSPGGYELRRYEPSIAAQTAMPTMGDTGTAFRAIAGYIFGGNEKQEAIAMTAPVVMNAPPVSEKIAMTAPVVMGAGTMAFVMPSKYKSIADLPKPKDGRVSLVQLPARTLAALRFGWYATPARFAAKAGELERLLARDGVKAISKPYLAGYNPPFSVPFLMRHDVLIEVEQK
ncbi:MAG: heme-binding protein [Hyphomicrobiaceae bacterium]